MSRGIESIIADLTEFKDEEVTVRERLTSDGYYIAVKFSEKLPESEIAIVGGTKPPKEALDVLGISLTDAPYFGVTSDFLRGAEWAIERLRNR
ncbi:hypothetical protein MOE57_14615 [Bacillus inaquosorum]|uniref:hypothetical protein n=1 Tax=Bacillus inaquosorum TaxID=483913 RepID=UPI00227FD79B|nr:hypothetical protein [Bacillus inaquosorum]MCY9083701.1 hypothetical protein [Bacillus inaquosorum]